MRALRRSLGLATCPTGQACGRAWRPIAIGCLGGCCPVADDEVGNLFTISLRDEDFGTVWFWDREKEASEGEPPAEDNIELKAPDWLTFLDSFRLLDEAMRQG